MTYRDAICTVAALERDELRKRASHSSDVVFVTVAKLRLNDPAEWRALHDAAGLPWPKRGGQYALFGKPKVTLAELREKLGRS